jgi:hypothetical protein
MGQSPVRGMHVLFHLLEHERVRALINTAVGGLTPTRDAGVCGKRPRGACTASGGSINRVERDAEQASGYSC